MSQIIPHFSEYPVVPKYWDLEEDELKDEVMSVGIIVNQKKEVAHQSHLISIHPDIAGHNIRGQVTFKAESGIVYSLEYSAQVIRLLQQGKK